MALAYPFLCLAFFLERLWCYDCWQLALQVLPLKWCYSFSLYNATARWLLRLLLRLWPWVLPILPYLLPFS